MKREREIESISMANCLMLLSRGSEFDDQVFSNLPNRVFECKTCSRQFPSFQALGGHRASHKKPRLSAGDGSNSESSQGSPAKPKTHECTICGLEFAIGQALGGHMRRHRTSIADHTRLPNLSLSSSQSVQVPVLKKGNIQGGGVLCLDLNLTPLENDRKFLQLGKPVSVIDCYL